MDNKIDYGIIYWNSSLLGERQIEISTWYAQLSERDRQMVDDIRQEAYDAGLYDAEEN